MTAGGSHSTRCENCPPICTRCVRRIRKRSGAPQNPRVEGAVGYSRDGNSHLPTASEGGADIWALPLDGKASHIRSLPIPPMTLRPLSPDGRWLAYISNESQAYQVYVQSFPISGAKQQISIPSGGGFEPLWSRDGKELFSISRPTTP